ncbi:MAG: hypothetical protein JY451_09255 [Erythrobacter sp.]|nr:MAG: hypothetical protein JY451_09255 [Erythrobacter sp.]
MTHDPAFDFRRLLSTGRSGEPLRQECQCVVGVAWSGRGVGVVALTPQASKSTKLKAYNNIAFGPIEADWHQIALKISQHLPFIFADKAPRVFVGGAIDRDGNRHCVRETFEKAFPSCAEAVGRDEVEEWVSRTPLSIAIPRVPPRDEWALKPLYAAAEIALFAGHMKLVRPASYAKGGER